MIRPAEPKDARDLARMGQAFFDTTPLKKLGNFDASSLFRFVAIEDHARTFVLEEDGKIIGAVSGVVYPLVFNNDIKVGQEIFWWVDPEHRKGLAGRRLHKRIEGWAKENGANVMFMIAIEGEAVNKVERLYNHYGYEKLEHTFMKEL